MFVHTDVLFIDWLNLINEKSMEDFISEKQKLGQLEQGVKTPHIQRDGNIKQ